MVSKSRDYQGKRVNPPNKPYIRGAYLICRASSAALIRERRLFQRLISQRKHILIAQFNLLHGYFSCLRGLKLPKFWLPQQSREYFFSGFQQRFPRC